MKPKAPKDSKRKPKEVSGKVKRTTKGLPVFINGRWYETEFCETTNILDVAGPLTAVTLEPGRKYREYVFDPVIDMGDMELTGYHNGIPVYTPKINTKDID